MKRVLCLLLAFMLMFNSVSVYAAIDPDVLEDLASNPEKYEPLSLKLTEFLMQSITGSSITDKFYGAASSDAIMAIKNILMSEGATKTDGNYYYIDQTTVNNINEYVQDKVHALGGYYLIEPQNISPADMAEKYELSDSEKNVFFEYISGYTVLFCYEYVLTSDILLYFTVPRASDGYCYVEPYSISRNENANAADIKGFVLDINWGFEGKLYDASFGVSRTYNYKDSLSDYAQQSYGQPFKIFYSKQDLRNYLNKGRTYAPQLPSINIKIPVSVVSNAPNITYNITTENKTEIEIQNEYNTTINNYYDELAQFTDGTTPAPSPTPTLAPGSGGSGGGSGDFSDGSVTPTPTPVPGIGDFTDTNNWLEKIYNWLLSFGGTHDSFAKTIADYIEANDGKLDEIITAIDSLHTGETETESGGCKYDFTALSSFISELWNDSDRKFDTMIDLLEENNEYQQQLVDSLDQIKKLLVTDDVMDIFKNRANETAQKAKEKFPTSIPWDIAMIVNAMSADPEKMKFSVPVVIKSLNINETMEIDLSSDEWDKLAEITRYFLSLLFILYLVHLTRKLFFNGGDE